MLSKYLKWAIWAGLLAIVLIAPFFVSKVMFFPFIAGKGFFFRIVVEIIFALWLILAMIDKNYRPKSSPVLWALTAVVAVLTLSTIFSTDPYRSFWSNFERMEGLITHLHLFAYFLVLISVLKSGRDWRRFFYAIAASGAGMGLYGYLQALGVLAISVQSGPRADGTFGNASYMAVFMLFNIFIAAFLYFFEPKKWLKNVFGVAALLEIPVIFLTATRGAILGLMSGIILLALLLSLFSKDKRIKIVSFSAIAGIIILAGLFLLVQNKNFILENPVISRFSNLSLQDRTVQSRFTIWEMSFKGFLERPLLGWGLDNYGQVFNKYYEPELWPQEPWFDRSHNIIFDWLTSGGILGLLSYLSLFAFAIYFLWKKYALEKNSENLMFAGIFTSLLAAYFFHNLFVFDNLISYILFFSVLAFIHHLSTNDTKSAKSLALGKNGESLALGMLEITPARSFASAFVIFALIFSLYFLNIKPISANTGLLQALKDINIQRQNVDLILSDFERVFGYRTFGTGEAREQLSAYANSVVKANIAQHLKDKLNQFSVSELERQVEAFPHDARGYLFLSAMYANAGRNEDALHSVEKALELSPKKQQILFLLADSYINLGNQQKAYEAVKEAYELAPEYDQAVKNFATIAIFSGRQEEGERALTNRFGTIIVADQQLINAYARVGKYGRVRDLWLEFIKNEPNKAQYHINLGATYMELGEPNKAIAELKRAIELDTGFKASGEYFINEIMAGRNPVSK